LDFCGFLKLLNPLAIWRINRIGVHKEHFNAATSQLVYNPQAPTLAHNTGMGWHKECSQILAASFQARRGVQKPPDRHAWQGEKELCLHCRE
jgi:pyrroloquinoline quinone (PQQ) biosynthesis protein C